MRASRLLPSLVLVLSMTGCLHAETGRERAATAPAATALSALRQWDEARARAWARADVAALRALYLPGSMVAARDASMLLRWRERGLRVERMQTQVLAVRIVAESPDRLVLVVTDRLALAVAAGRGQRVVLPADGVTTRRVTLSRVSGAWRMASVLPASAKP